MGNVLLLLLLLLSSMNAMNEVRLDTEELSINIFIFTAGLSSRRCFEPNETGPPTGYFLADCLTRLGVLCFGFTVYVLDFETNFNYHIFFGSPSRRPSD